MHTATFQDDATRGLRAVRYAAKLGFRLHPTTRRWLRQDLNFVDAISPARIHRELVRTLAEPTGARALLSSSSTSGRAGSLSMTVPHTSTVCGPMAPNLILSWLAEWIIP